MQSQKDNDHLYSGLSFEHNKGLGNAQVYKRVEDTEYCKSI